MIQACQELLRSGRSLSEILDETKRLLDISGFNEIHSAGESHNARVSHGPDAARSDTSDASELRASDFAESAQSSVVDQSQSVSDRLAGDAVFDIRPNAESRAAHKRSNIAGAKQPSARRLARWSGPARLLIITVTCSAALTIPTVVGTVAYLPSAAEATVSIATSTGNPAAQTSQIELAPSSAERAPAITASSDEPSNVAHRLSTEQIATLLARGDALVSMADVTSARLFYERAVAAGNATAAIPLSSRGQAFEECAGIWLVLLTGTAVLENSRRAKQGRC
jgi:hypothetical protein